MDETKIIAAILSNQILVLEDVAGDPVNKTVDLYERVLAELRARGHGAAQPAETTRRFGSANHRPESAAGERSTASFYVSKT